MSQRVNVHDCHVYKLVLTGGPCGGKTTVQARMSTFFENVGWKVFRVPETATILLSGGIKFAEMSPCQAYEFQKDLLRTMLAIEDTFFRLADAQPSNSLIICDRGFMDPSAFIHREDWDRLKTECHWNEVEMRDNRYDHVIHLVSAAKGAEKFYSLENNKAARSEGLELAREMDDRAQKAWIGHPYFDVIDNSTDFEKKVLRAIQAVCERLHVPSASNLLQNRIMRRKFLLRGIPSLSEFPVTCVDFECVHDYLTSPATPSHQARIRRRGKDGVWSYTHTVRRPAPDGQRVELKMAVDERQYRLLLSQKDLRRASIYMTRRCFTYNNNYYQVDIFEPPSPARCRGLVILTTYTDQSGEHLMLPPFLDVVEEITHSHQYSMYNLAVITDLDMANGAGLDASPAKAVADH